MFVSEFIKTGSGRKAAIAAGYSPASAGSKACHLLNLPEIKALVDAEIERLKARNQLSASRVLEELRRWAFLDVACLYNDVGRLLPLSQWPEDARSCIQSIEVVDRNLTTGDGIQEQAIKVKFVDRSKAVELLCKYFGLLSERVEHSGELVIRHEMLAAPIDARPVSPDPPKQLPNAAGEQKGENP